MKTKFPPGIVVFFLFLFIFGSVAVEAGLVSGDINADESISLDDPISGLRICAGLNASGAINPDADIDADTCVGLPEVIHALQRATNPPDSGDWQTLSHGIPLTHPGYAPEFRQFRVVKTDLDT